MRITLGSQLLPSIILATIFITINPNQSQAMDFTSKPNQFTTAPGLLENEDASNSQKKSNQTSGTTRHSALISPTGKANTSQVANPLFNDTAASNSSAMETIVSFADSLQNQTATDLLGFIVPHGQLEKNVEEAGNTSHPSSSFAPKLGALPNDSDELGSSELWNTSSTLPLPDANQRKIDYSDSSRTSGTTTRSSTRADHKISLLETWLMKKELKGPHLADQHRVTGKMLVLFLGIAGVLVCLLILVYFIYSRTYKSEMFSHHRLYGEGFEDPVLHLDTPMDRYDFFSFSDSHEHSVRTLQQVNNAKGEVPPLQTGASHYKKQSGVLQMESVVAVPTKNSV